MPNTIVVDAGPLIALFKKSDRHHKTALKFLAKSEASALVTNLLVIGEVAHMLGERLSDLELCLNWIVDNIDIDTEVNIPRSIEVMKKYRDLPADLADASLVAMCERLGVNAVASTDSDFNVYRLPRGKKFANVFFDE